MLLQKQQEEIEEENESPLNLSEALDWAFGTKREKTQKIINFSVFFLSLLSLSILYISRTDLFVFYLALGFLALTLAFAAVFNWYYSQGFRV